MTQQFFFSLKPMLMH